VAAPLLGEVRDHLDRHQRRLPEMIVASDPASGGEALGRRHAKATDGLLRSLFVAAQGQVGERPGARLPVALAAVGSYGRGAVALGSDLDVRILARKPAVGAAFAEAMLYPLWDAGLTVGHQVVTPADLIELGEADLPTATSLLDWRHLAGDEGLSARLLVRARAVLFEGPALQVFLGRLADEAAARHERLGGSVFLLEPDVKGGAGGLRDLDIVLWVARARWGAETLSDLVARGVLGERALAEILEARELLWRVRNRMHRAAGRRVDRLSFDLQESIAPSLGYLARARELVGSNAIDGEALLSVAVEAFMSDYYRHARHIAQALELTLLRARAAPRQEAPVEARPAASRGVVLRGGALGLGEIGALESDPAVALRLLTEAVAGQQPLEVAAREAVARASREPSFGEALRASAEARALFLDLCTGAAETPQLRRSVMAELHELGLLVALVPEFAPVVGRVHHDVYHVYTVDVHSGAALDRLKALMRGDLAADYPLACRLAAEVSQPEVLAVATLLHDVGKALGGNGHAARGAQMARVIGERLGLSLSGIDQVAHLVLTHLLMYHLATRRDVDDPATVDELLREVRGSENLRELYLLTVADLSTTSPTALTTWKAKLLDDLYVAAEARLAGQVGDGARVQQRVDEVLARAADSPVTRSFLASMPARYLLSSRADDVVAHLEVATRARGDSVAFSLRPSAHAGLAELCVVAPDRPGLLASIAAAIVACRLEIQAAQIFSHVLGEGRVQVVDLFWVRISDPSELGRARAALDRELAAFLDGRRAVAEVLGVQGGSRWGSRPAPAVPTTVSIDDRSSATHAILEVMTRDRPGVLCALAEALHALGLSIATAKINTEGARVADVFYLTDSRGSKLDLGPRRGEIERAIGEALVGLSRR
jgi:[protein-PII] uridylyltransferase